MTSRVVAEAGGEVNKAVVLQVSGGLHIFQLRASSLKLSKGSKVEPYYYLAWTLYLNDKYDKIPPTCHFPRLAIIDVLEICTRVDREMKNSSKFQLHP